MFVKTSERVKKYYKSINTYSVLCCCLLITGCTLGLEQEIDLKEFDSADDAFSGNNSNENNTGGSSGGNSGESQYTDEICNDGIDNDGDSLIDCADNDCFTSTDCLQDNDGDGYFSTTDCNDNDF